MVKYWNKLCCSCFACAIPNETLFCWRAIRINISLFQLKSRVRLSVFSNWPGRYSWWFWMPTPSTTRLSWGRLPSPPSSSTSRSPPPRSCCYKLSRLVFPSLHSPVIILKSACETWLLVCEKVKVRAAWFINLTFSERKVARDSEINGIGRLRNVQNERICSWRGTKRRLQTWAAAQWIALTAGPNKWLFIICPLSCTPLPLHINLEG